MSLKIRLFPLFALLFAHSARAHIGASVAKANYLHPAAPGTLTVIDGGVHYDYSSYVPEEADASYLITWTDGDTDPTGKFTFYFLDHCVSDALDADQMEMVGTIVHDTRGREARNVYVACDCDADAGVKCPDINDAGPTGERWCDNFVAFDTSALTDGEYWIAAVNNDPPFHVYNLSEAPVRVHHGNKPPPVVIITRPDGLLYADRSYETQFIALGTGPLTLDLSYGDNSVDKVLGPTMGLAKAIPVTRRPDGTTAWIWDTSSLANGNYFLRATLKDAVGGHSYTDSRFPLAVFHPPALDGGAPLDAAEPMPDDGAPVILPAPKKSGCEIAGGSSPCAFLLVFGALSALFTRRALRRGSRTGCTG